MLEASLRVSLESTALSGQSMESEADASGSQNVTRSVALTLPGVDSQLGVWWLIQPQCQQ